MAEFTVFLFRIPAFELNTMYRVNFRYHFGKIRTPPPKTNKQTKQKKTRNLNTFHLMVTLDNFLFVPYSWVIERTTDIFELFLINLQAQK